jgi:transcriptional regulator with XRE-family HTH domain
VGQRPRTLRPYASPDAFFGAQLRTRRIDAGLSQAELGRLVHVSGDLIGKIEKTQRRVHPRLADDLDTALGAEGTLAECAPSPWNPQPVSSQHGDRSLPGEAKDRGAGTAPARTRPIAAQPLDALVTGQYRHRDGRSSVVPSSGVTARVSLARLWRSYQDARFVETARLVAALVPALEESAAGGASRGRNASTAAVAFAYHAAAATATKLGSTEVAWVCADRGLAAARAGSSQAAVASLSRSVAHVLLSTRRYEAATELAEQAARDAGPALGPGPLRWSLAGSLHLVAAMACARSGEPGEAWRHWGEAARLAEILGRDANVAWTAFGPSNVAVHQLSVQVESGDLSASQSAQPLPGSGRLPRERRIRHDLEVARVWSATGRDEEAAALVVAAHRDAPDQVRHHCLARGLAANWSHRPVANHPDIKDLIRALHPDEPVAVARTAPLPWR